MKKNNLVTWHYKTWGSNMRGNTTCFFYVFQGVHFPLLNITHQPTIRYNESIVVQPPQSDIKKKRSAIFDTPHWLYFKPPETCQNHRLWTQDPSPFGLDKPSCGINFDKVTATFWLLEPPQHMTFSLWPPKQKLLFWHCIFCCCLHGACNNANIQK